MHIQKISRRSHSNALFTVVIPSWNNLPFLKVAVESLLKNAAFPHQVIVHVNEGSDDTLNWVQSQEYLDYTWSEQNIGVCYALNACRSLVQSEYILYMNDDMYACPGWDHALYREVQNIGHQHFYLSGTMIERDAAAKPYRAHGNYGATPDDFREELLLADLSMLKRNHWCGATWPPSLVHRDLWDLVGGYSTEFSPGLYSDPDFSMKLWQAGVRHFMGVGDALVYHFGTKTTSRVRLNNGRKTFLWKWGMPSSAFVKDYLRQGELFNGPLNDPPPASFFQKKLYTAKRIPA